MNFRKFIISKFAPILSKKYVDILTDDRSIKIFQQSFTSSTFDEKCNYEFYEQMGDVSANKFLVYYFYKRFPCLMCALGVKVVARLKINYGSKKVFSRLAEQQGFWPYIRASDEWKDKRRTDLLEDTFEAFVGATEFILNDRVEDGVGGVAISMYLKSVFDTEHISLKYEDLYDSKTRLKELMDKISMDVGKLKYNEIKDVDANNRYFTTSRISLIPRHGRCKEIAAGTGRTKSEAQRAAAKEAIFYFATQGYEKKPPPEYSMFQKH